MLLHSKHLTPEYVEKMKLTVTLDLSDSDIDTAIHQVQGTVGGAVAALTMMREQKERDLLNSIVKNVHGERIGRISIVRGRAITLSSSSN